MGRSEPERTCIVTRDGRSARGADPLRRRRRTATVVPDLRRKLPGPRRLGHGAGGRRSRGGQARACSPGPSRPRSRCRRGSRTRSTPRCGQDLRQALALANKAGAVVAGFAKVEAAIAEGRLGALIHAAEAAEDGRRKLAGALRKRLRRRDIGRSGGHRAVRRGIGFGIRPVKCDTCCRRRGRLAATDFSRVGVGCGPIAASEADPAELPAEPGQARDGP